MLPPPSLTTLGMDPQAARLTQSGRVRGIVAKALEGDRILDKAEVGGGEIQFQAAESARPPQGPGSLANP
jgi:hypothetical protein